VLGAYVLDRETRRVLPLPGAGDLPLHGRRGKVYLYTSNPDVATGDGVAMPTAPARRWPTWSSSSSTRPASTPQAKSFLVTEALRGEGAVLRRPDGEAFMKRYDPARELAPRDVVARAIDNEMKVHGFDCVYSTSRTATRLRARPLPDGVRDLPPLRDRHDAAADPVVPAAHYACGGVLADLDGATALDRLYACGEVACTGLHGANRLARTRSSRRWCSRTAPRATPARAWRGSPALAGHPALGPGHATDSASRSCRAELDEILPLHVELRRHRA